MVDKIAWALSGSILLGCLIIGMNTYAEKLSILDSSSAITWKGNEFPLVNIEQNTALGIIPKVPDIGYTDRYQGVDIVLEMPWRVQVRSNLKENENFVPFLLFVPDSRFPAIGADGRDVKEKKFPLEQSLRRELKPSYLALKKIVITSNGNTIYLDEFSKSPSHGLAFEIVDEMGNQIRRQGQDLEGLLAIDSTIKASNEGWHRILRIPISAIGWTGNEKTQIATIHAELTYQRVYDKASSDNLVQEKTFRVLLSSYALPTLGDNWVHLDTHNHSTAEYSTKDYSTAPRKAFGSPIQMLKESLYAIGLVDVHPSLLSLSNDNPIITTDHNTFLDDEDIIKVGPTSKDAQNGWIYPDPEPTHFSTLNGKLEFQRMRTLLGELAGEELTLAGPQNKGLGSHLLAYRTRHFSGAWHGGCLEVTGALSLFKTLYQIISQPDGSDCNNPFPNKNNNTLPFVLQEISRSNDFREGFAYASHPYDSLIPWPKQFLESGFFDRTGNFIKNSLRHEFVLKGLQIWNGRYTWQAIGSINGKDDIDFYHLDPFGKAGWTFIKTDQKSYISLLDEVIAEWHKMVTKGLSFSFESDPDIKFIRKIYASAGSDAHGDFNYETAIPGTIIQEQFGTDWGWTVSNNGFAVVRAYVDTSPHSSSDTRSIAKRTLDGLSYGNFILTDGPVLTFDIDSDVNFDSDKLVWSEGSVATKPWNKDGQIGGGPSQGRRAGNFDGGRTMLIRRDSATPRIRYRWDNTSEFGGAPQEVLVFTDSIENKAGQVAAKLPPGEHKIQNVMQFPQELSIKSVSAMSLGVRSGNPTAISRFEKDEPFSAFTNPVWIIPVDVTCYVTTPLAGKDVIEAGNLLVKFSFDLSMSGLETPVRLELINDDGNSMQTTYDLSPVDSAATQRGWQMREGVPGVGTVKNGTYTVRNISPIPVQRFAIYLIRPEDANGNELNSIAAALSPTRECHQ